MFGNCHIDLRLFFLAALIMAQSSRLVPGAQLSDMLGISHNSAVSLRTRLWRRMAEIAPTCVIGGPGLPVEVDELLVSRYVRRRKTQHRWNAIGLTDRSTYRVFLAPDRKRRTLWPLIRKTVLPGSIINTDGWRAYRGLEREGFEHIWCNHSKGIFKGLDGATTTSIDGYWHEVKLSLSHAHQGVGEDLLELFLQAHASRYSYRESSGHFFWSLVGCDPAVLATEEWCSGEWEAHRRYDGSQKSRNSFIKHQETFTSEHRAREAMGAMALERQPQCPHCLAPRMAPLGCSRGKDSLRAVRPLGKCASGFDLCRV